MAWTVELDGRRHQVTILARRPRLVLAVDGRRYVVDAGDSGPDGRRSLRIDGRERAFTRTESPDGSLVRLAGRTYAARRIGAAAEAGAGGGSAHVVRAPMPGLVIALRKAPGDAVRRGETVLTIESMKLQMNLDSPRDGEIAEILVREGEGFQKDAVLVRLAIPQEGETA